VIRRSLGLLGVLVVALWLALPAQAYFPFANQNASYHSGTVCSDTSLHTVTASGTSSTTIAAGCHHITLVMIGPGGSGADQTNSNHPTGGGGGAEAESDNLSVTPGGTLWWHLFAGGASQTAGPANGNSGAGKSWASITSNAAPATSSDGVMADFGVGGGQNATLGTGGLTANSVGQILHSGGNGFQPSTSVYGGGGSSACPTANGNNATSATGASACTGGGSGGSGSGSSPGAGGAPGGGGGATLGSGNSGAGGASQLTYQQSTFLEPANDNIPEAIAQCA